MDVGNENRQTNRMNSAHQTSIHHTDVDCPCEEGDQWIIHKVMGIRVQKSDDSLIRSGTSLSTKLANSTTQLLNEHEPVESNGSSSPIRENQLGLCSLQSISD